MKPFQFERALSAKDLADMFEILFIDMMEGIARHLQLPPDFVEQHLPKNVDVQVKLIDVSSFLTNGRPSEDISALKRRLSQQQPDEDMSIVDEINGHDAAQGGKGKLIRKNDRVKIAQAFLEEGSWHIATKEDTIFLLLMKPDHIPNANYYMATLAGLKEHDVPPSQLDLQTLQNMHLLRHMGDRAYAIAMLWLDNVLGPMLIEATPKGKARKDMKDNIATLVAPETFAIHRAQRFDEMLAAARRAKGDAGVQQYRDAQMFHALAHGGDMEMLTGKLMDLPYLGLKQLRQAFAVHQHGLQNADPHVAMVAEFLSVQAPKDEGEAIKLFRTPIEQLLEMGLSQDMAETLHRTKPKFAKSEAVQAYIKVLRDANHSAALSDVEKVVPFLFEYIKTQSERMAPYASLRNALQDVLSGQATDQTYASIDKVEDRTNMRTVIDVYSFVLAQRYLDVAQALMPQQFPKLAPERSMQTDARLAAMKRFLDADWSKAGHG